MSEGANTDTREATIRRALNTGPADLAGVFAAAGTALHALVAEHDRYREVLENLDEDATTVEAQDLTLHEMQQRLGAILLGFGGGHNHLEDIRAALAEGVS